MRRNITELCRELARLPGLDELVITSNGTQLARLAEPLREAGVKRLNISLDTLDAEKFARITRWSRLPQVLDGIRAAQDGDPAAFAEIVRRERMKLLRTARAILLDRHEAEDVVQEVFLKVLNSELEPDNFRAWIYKIARNRCLDLLRARKRRQRPVRSVGARLGELARPVVVAVRGDVERHTFSVQVCVRDRHPPYREHQDQHRGAAHRDSP